MRTPFQLFVAAGLALALAGVGFALYASADPPGSGTIPRTIPPEASVSRPAPKATEADYQNALVAAIHRLSETGLENEHLAVLLERHPKLVSERVTHKQLRKPLTTDSYTALHFAARAGNSEGVKILLAYKADVNAAGGTGWTPLHIAAQRGELGVVKLLVAAGANVDAKTEPLPGGIPPSSPGLAPGEKPLVLPAVPAMTPLDLAKDAKRTEVIEYLSNLKR